MKKIIGICKKIYLGQGIRGLFTIFLRAFQIRLFNLSIYPLCKSFYRRKLKDVISTKYDRVVIWNNGFGWNVTLFQRPQHIAKALSKQGSLVFYEVTRRTDKEVHSFKKISENLFLINRENRSFRHILFDELSQIEIPKYMQIYSTELELSAHELGEFMDAGFNILYEYIDDIHPDISGTKTVPENILSKYNFVMSHSEIPVVVTADRLKEDVEKHRGNRNLAYSTNGVDYEHFSEVPKVDKKDLTPQFEKVIDSGKVIIGYYGALASWFDYQLVKEVAKKRKDVVFVLIGKIYDEQYSKMGLEDYDNIVYCGEVPYDKLPLFACYFDICTIPFIVNELTNATSPLKLFEYMALKKPIITTGMYECRKYRSVMIANDSDDFCRQIDNAVKYINMGDKEYYALLEKEALENTWDSKAKSIVDMLRKFEG